MNKTDKLKNTLINLSAFSICGNKLVGRRKGCTTVLCLLDHKTIVHLAVNGFLKFHETKGGLFSDNWMFWLLESVSGFHAFTENRFLGFTVK